MKALRTAMYKRYINSIIIFINTNALFFKRSIHRHSNPGILNALQASIGPLPIVSEVLKNKKTKKTKKTKKNGLNGWVDGVPFG